MAYLNLRLDDKMESKSWKSKYVKSGKYILFCQTYNLQSDDKNILS